MRDSKIVLRRALIFGALAFGAMFNNSMIVAQVITAKQPCLLYTSDAADE